MFNIQDETERNLITNGEVNKEMMIENWISKLMKRKIVRHERNAPLNMKIAQKSDGKVPDEECEYFDKGKLIKFAYIKSDIQKRILTINAKDIIVLLIDTWGISLVLQQSVFDDDWELFKDNPPEQKNKNNVIFCQRMIYKDAIPMLEKLGYKKESESIVVDKEGSKVADYYICEEWTHDKHYTICEFLAKKFNKN